MLAKYFSILVISAVLFITNLNVAEGDDIEDKLLKIVALMQNRIDSLEESKFAIGSIQNSFLSEGEFQKLMGKGWVLCDRRSMIGDRSVSSTGRGRISGKVSIPNCTGRFLRTSGGNAGSELGALQAQTTAKNGLLVNQASPSGNFGTTTNGQHGHSVDYHLKARVSDHATGA